MPRTTFPEPAGVVPPDIAAVLLAVPPHPALAAAGRARSSAVTPARLVSVALRLAADAEHWRHSVDFRGGLSADHPAAVRVERTDDYEAWALGWLPGQDTGTHDHVGSTAALCLAAGRLRLRSTGPGGAVRTPEPIALTPGAVRVIGSSDVHRLWNADPEPAVSIHVYAPKRMMRRR